MEQISIWDIIPKKEELPIREPCGRRCSCECFSLNCYINRGYVRHKGKWVRNEDGSIMIMASKACDWIPIDESNPWIRITNELVWVYKSSIKEYTREPHDPEVLDHIGKGTVDEKPAIIGLSVCVSGVGEEFEGLYPFYWKGVST